MIASKLDGGRLIGIDQDADAIRAAGEKLAPYGETVTIVKNNFKNIDAVLNELELIKLTARSSIWAFRRTSSTKRSVALAIWRTRRLICG